MRFDSVPFETMLNELEQQRREHPDWGFAMAQASLVQAGLQGNPVQAIRIQGSNQGSGHLPAPHRPRRALR